MNAESPQRAVRACLLLMLLCLPGAAAAAIVDAIEYYNAGLDHYFVTASADEIGKLDSGFFVGWQRTRESFKVADSAAPLPGGAPVCRFYGNPAFGLDSHFYSASPAECSAVQQKFPEAWLLESNNVFSVYFPDTISGACPGGSVPIYRAWNGRIDSNHRYTTDAAIQRAMVAKGYTAEGYGSPAMPVAMCAPTSLVALPQCTASASNTSPVVGSSTVLSASCSGTPTSFAWSGCSSSEATCTATSSAAGTLNYTVVAANAAGNSAPASVTVAWRSAPANLPPPVCNLAVTANSDPPAIGATALISATCTNAPTRYTWTGCDSGSNSCTAYETMPGAHTYSVVASNEGGFSPPASVTLNWASTPPAAPDFCSPYPAVLSSSQDWINGTLTSASFRDPPGFAWNGVWIVRITVPFGTPASSTAGRIFVAEYDGQPTYRDVSISRFACDFRNVDPAGNNGPVAQSNGISAGGPFVIGPPSSGMAGLVPGQSYYINVRNRAPDGAISCAEQQKRCDAFVSVNLPR